MDNFVHIQGLHIKNFKALADVKMGRLWNEQAAEPLTPITTVIGKNGTGKSSLMDAFGFLADCLKYGVEIACDEQNRGGYEKIHSLGKKDRFLLKSIIKKVVMTDRLRMSYRLIWTRKDGLLF